MRAAVLETFGVGLTVTEWPDPVPGPNEALIRVRAAGVCGSDLKVTSGAIPGLRTPLVIGHEVAGELVADAGDLRAGQRVAAYIFQPCNRCAWCRRDEQNLCPTAQRIGFERDGGMAELLVVGAENLVPFGDGLSFAEAAVTMDAVLSPWRALRVRGRVGAGMTVAVVGAGGLGLHAVQIARSLGARVVAVDPDVGHRHLAVDAGAEAAVAPADSAELRTWADGIGVDVALESSGAPAGFRTALDLVRVGGSVVCCGYQPGADFAFDSMRVALSEITVCGSRGGSRPDAVAALAAVERSEVTPLIDARGALTEINTFLDRLRSGGALGRLVVEM